MIKQALRRVTAITAAALVISLAVAAATRNEWIAGGAAGAVTFVLTIIASRTMPSDR